jgi:hypothetical protein
MACHTRVASPPLSDLKMSDPRSEKQLIAGFWALEQGKWRWTARKFAAVLLPPPGSRQNGTTLRLQFFIPSQVVDKLGPLTLRASVGETSLESERITVGGALSYTSYIRPSLIGSNLLPIVFTLDKALPKSDTDGRELGMIVSELALESKESGDR